MNIQNEARGLRFLLGVLQAQQADPFCRRCSAFRNTLLAARERAAACRTGRAGEIAGLPAELAVLLADAGKGLAGIPEPSDAVGQKRAGNCMLPEGQCFIKASLALLQRI